MERQIILAKSAGFCFGVNRAVKLVEQLAESGNKVCTLGPIIHNKQMVDQLNKKGVRIAESETIRRDNGYSISRSDA